MVAGEPRRTRPGEWVVAVGGGLLLAAGLVTVLRGGDDPVPVAPAAAWAPAPTVPAPAVAATVPAAISSPAPVPVPKLVLRGLVQRPDGAAAIIETSDGRQRLVRVGGQVLPGVRVERVTRAGVELVGGAGRQLLRFGDADGALEPVAVAAPSSVAALAGSVNAYRLGMEARREGGLTRGYAVVDTARLPLLQKAGIRPGDVVLAVNGAALASEEKLMELPNEVAGAYSVVISFERNGQPMSATVEVQKRP